MDIIKLFFTELEPFAFLLLHVPYIFIHINVLLLLLLVIIFNAYMFFLYI